MENHSQGVLNGKITKLNGCDDKFRELVKDLPREVQIASWTHHKMVKMWMNKEND